VEKKIRIAKWTIGLCVVITTAAIVIAITTGQSNRPARFKAVETYTDCTVLVDTETGVSYVQYGKALAPLYDADGNLYRSNGWRDTGT